MSGGLVECVPNFSEGRRRAVVEQIVAAVNSVDGVKLLDYSMDADHNRSVLTFVGGAGAVCEAAFRAVATAARLINMEEHTGEHPRIGAADVVPFVPLCGTTMQECVEIARELGKRVAGELGIPVYLYGEAATRPERKNLANIRRGQYEGLKRSIASPERWPDFGAPRLHPTAGATAIGARDFLVAYNINLATSDVSIAKKIAKRVREKDGGLKHVRALGVMLHNRQVAQVTMNLLNFRETPVHEVFNLVKAEAERYGVSVTGSEIIGLVPLDALLDVASYYLGLEGRGSRVRDHILEARLWDNVSQDIISQDT
ncbi:MAG TPA: glutamate formimidoyltransferase [Firmicutes bacterium]|nr:glutamate formimidoyltransferase [Bacillota bacterium]